MASANPAQPSAAEAPATGAPGAFQAWVIQDGAWYASSFVFHMLLMCVLMLISAGAPPSTEGQDAPSFEEAQLDEQLKQEDAKIDKFEVGETPIDPSELNTDTLTLAAAPGATETVQADYIDDSPTYLQYLSQEMSAESYVVEKADTAEAAPNMARPADITRLRPNWSPSDPPMSNREAKATR